MTPYLHSCGYRIMVILRQIRSLDYAYIFLDGHYPGGQFGAVVVHCPFCGEWIKFEDLRPERDEDYDYSQVFNNRGVNK